MIDILAIVAGAALVLVALADLVNTLVDCLADFHRSAACGAEIAAGGAPQGIGAVLQDNFRGVRTFRGQTISAHDDDGIVHAGRGGAVAVRKMMNLSSSFDHRFVDGYDAAAMIQRIKEMLEHPATIFL